jgi:hypothetical protein
MKGSKLCLNFCITLVSATLDLINAKIRDIFNTLGVDATTISITTISIMTLSITTISRTISA